MLKNKSGEHSKLITYSLIYALKIIYTSRICMAEILHNGVLLLYLPNSTFKNLTKLAIVGVFTPWKSTNTTSQGLISCFADYLQLRK